MLGAQDVTVSVTVVALVGTRPFPLVAVQPLNFAADLTASVDPGSVSVVLAGTVSFLNSLGNDAVSATVDLGGRGPGTYVLEVTLRAPSGVTVQSLQPARVAVTIRSTRPPPTPSPSPTPASP